MSTGLIVGIVVVIVVLIGWGVGAYNNLVTLKNRVKNGWAQIDVQLKQRADLIPNLVNTVKGYASHESEVFTQVTAARAGVVAAASNPSTTTAQRAAAENQLSRALFNLQATAEAYPQLQANQNFMDLQNQLKELENKIAYARQIYNDVVLKLNTAIETVPTNIIAGLGLSLFGVGEWVGGWWCWSGSLGVWIPRRCSPPPCNCLTRGGCRAWSSVTRRTADGNCISRSGSRRVRGSPARNRGAARPRVRCMTRGSACGGI